MDEMARRVSAVPVAGGRPPAVAPHPGPPAATAGKPPAIARPAAPADEDDLAALTAALEEELFEDDDEPLVPRESSEQSLEDIFAAFKQHVQQEIGSEDYRTHYDLGIAYKGMGLVEEAVAEFEIAARAGEVRWEALSMIALCHRERNEIESAIAFYRKAIVAAVRDSRALASLRYDLGEALLQIGNASEALDEFRSVLEEDPGYRDVKGRVSELEARVESL
jgi:tetratricopeptide (TPR) repeat protein